MNNEESVMNQYEPGTGTPRMMFGCAAVAMTALTFALFVIGPAAMDSSRWDSSVAMASGAPRTHATAGIDARTTTAIDIVAVRTAGSTVQQCAQFRNDLST
jgi:hypothetical protein